LHDNGGKLVAHFHKSDVQAYHSQVWSFAPPDEAMIELNTSSSPQSLPDQHMDDYEVGQHSEDHHGEADTDMSDAGQQQLALQRDPRRHFEFSPLQRH